MDSIIHGQDRSGQVKESSKVESASEFEPRDSKIMTARLGTDNNILKPVISDNGNRGPETYIDRIKERRLRLYTELLHLEKQIRPTEFESYADYYLINTFKIGKSASGRVNVDGLRSLGNGGPYRRIKRASRRSSPSVPRSNRSRSGSASSEEAADKTSDSDADQTPKESDNDYKPNNNWKVSREISATSIINEDTSGPVRRSTRLTRKEKEKQLNREKNLKKDSDQIEIAKKNSSESSSIIQDLYENLVSKLREPVRRSDWLLPPKNRYVAEKNQPVKHEPEQIKINELARNTRIKKILSRFDGGLAGVRTGA